MSMFDKLCEGKEEHIVFLLSPYFPSVLVYGPADDGPLVFLEQYM
jgi:hypothetical protein